MEYHKVLKKDILEHIDILTKFKNTNIADSYL